jgi:hypothetical protein
MILVTVWIGDRFIEHFNIITTSKDYVLAVLQSSLAIIW